MDPPGRMPRPPQPHPPFWAFVVTLLTVMLVYCHLAAGLGTGALRTPRPGVLLPAWNSAYGLEFRDEFDDFLGFRPFADLPRTELAEAVGARNLWAILGASLLLTVAGFVVGGSARRLPASGPWMKGRRYRRMVAWVLATFPWTYLAIYGAAGVGYPLLLQQYVYRNAGAVPAYDPAGDPYWSVPYLAALATGLLVAVALYRHINGVAPSVAALLGVDLPEDHGFSGYSGVPSLRGEELGIVREAE
ncbi:MAG TPA: hypothetical protein VEI97_08930 [bacterium]|nr:hypothetical protein [bacterium]